MSIQDWGAIGEIVGAVGVVVSLLYLANQVRLNAKATEDSTMREIFTAAGVHANAMAESPNRKAIIKGLIDYPNLAGEDKFAFDSLLGGLMNIVESSIVSTSSDFLPSETPDNWADYLHSRFFAYDGFRAWWGDSRKQYCREFREWVDHEISNVNTEMDFWKIK